MVLFPEEMTIRVKLHAGNDEVGVIEHIQMGMSHGHFNIHDCGSGKI